MNRTMQQYFSLMAATLASLIGMSAAPVAVAQHTITFVGKTADTTDYSPTGMNVGTAGFWFPQFNAQSFVTNQAVNNNQVNQFPSWILPNFNSADTTANTGYSFSSTDYSEGGDPNWNTLKLPNGVTGLSGELVDSNTANNTNNTISQLLLGPGTPYEFLMHIVVDNTATTNLHRDAGRVEARGAFPPPANGTNVNNQQTPGLAGFNGVADVYTFRYTGWGPDEILKVRLNSGIVGERGGIAGLMFDVTIVPEPSTALLLLIGFGAMASQRQSRRSRRG
jgi:hypothetical protein